MHSGRHCAVERRPDLRLAALLGFDLQQYEQLFSVKLDHFAARLPEEPVTSSGDLRAPLVCQRVYPETENGLNARIAATVRPLGLDRFDLRYASGPTPHEDLMTSVDLYGREVILRVRGLLDEAHCTVGVTRAISRL